MTTSLIDGTSTAPIGGLVTTSDYHGWRGVRRAGPLGHAATVGQLRDIIATNRGGTPSTTRKRSRSSSRFRVAKIVPFSLHVRAVSGVSVERIVRNRPS